MPRIWRSRYNPFPRPAVPWIMGGQGDSMSSGYRRFLFLLLIFIASPLLAEAPFTVSGASSGNDAELLPSLQHQAVEQWLQRYLGSAYEANRIKVTPEFAKRYILDFSVGHPAGNRSVTVLTGHLDSDAL